jgi:uncharacterized protein YjbJ (UPF0337 family)
MENIRTHIDRTRDIKQLSINQTNMNTVPEVSTGDKIKGKLKEGVGKVIGDHELKEEGKAVKKVEKDAHKVEKQQEKVNKEHAKVYEHSAQAGVQDPSNVGLGEKIVGGVKQGVGSLIGDKQMEKEGKAVGKVEEDYSKLEKEREKQAKHQGKLNEHRLKADI